MRPQDIYSTIRSFLALVEQGTGSVEGNEKMLSLLVDRLALASHYRIRSGSRLHLPDPPDRDLDALHDRVTERLPNYSYYNIPEFIVHEVAQTHCLVGDAIDDIVDIAVDMYDVEWYRESGSSAGALSYFEERYRENWGAHLRQLQLYIFAFSRQGHGAAPGRFH